MVKKVDKKEKLKKEAPKKDLGTNERGEPYINEPTKARE